MTIHQIVASLAFALTLSGPVVSAERLGGYSPVEIVDKNVVSAAAFAVLAQQKILNAKRGEGPVKLVLVEIEEAQQQVVAGMNFWMRLKVSLGGEEKQANVIVWWQEWRKPDPYRLTQWTWE